MKTLIKNAEQIVTVDTKGKNVKRGKLLSEIAPLSDHSILVEDGIIKDFIPNSNSSKTEVEKIIDAQSCIILPGLVECHTHAAYAGSRANEFLMRLKGATYEEIAKSGGGITSTMKAVRNSSFEELVKLLKPRIDHFISQGVTTLEIKSGYGLSFYDEIKLLQVINHFRVHSSIDIVPTFLGAHTYPPEYKNDHGQYLKLIIEELLPYIIKNKLADHVDAFCEKTAFSSEDVDLIFTKAKKLGYKLRLHTEQFNVVGGLDVALKHKALSVDHLEVIADDDIPKLAKSNTAAVLLPGVSFFLNCPFAPARKLIENNAIVALATDYNPGSSHIPNLQLIMQLAALNYKMSSEEIISAATINSAYAMGVQENIGSLEIGKQADFAIFEAKDISEIIYNIGINLNKYTIKKGKIVYSRNVEN
ncbi:MAG: imidazolonepropionase [Stygiobacter sp. RIFOXYC12_FULL_38_8]|nr:MAG: imidazolonepropionase [Stygiobacter sp. GWC2_38_9]OGV06105.1 MAG: imidazolonepropionase [Stygiobacter sp. RIFOXYB2_FULL_37_11]OGV16830.1 MAG: imidazolonepropionase [Stygiobacter sp. RIFOXYC2_FULL_38_25]OGV23458.1 MAG: imidazolonepropionase [Stygiobacter sp. RIFOXYC12_FULL_38_8]OGV82819.1 MAG: imidazolonepropionase [Stygiobacter sp. GWF2_38_21]